VLLENYKNYIKDSNLGKTPKTTYIKIFEKFENFIRNGEYTFTDNKHYIENREYFYNKNWKFDEKKREVSSYKKYLQKNYPSLNKVSNIEDISINELKILKRKIDMNQGKVDPLLYGFNRAVDNGTLSAALNFLIEFLEENKNQEKEEKEKEEVKKLETTSTDETTRNSLIQSRKGQGKYRKNLIIKWKSCSVTGLKNTSFLRASHIKPWGISSNEERLDTDNGLLLTPALDHLFDGGYISFDNNGKIMISEEIPEHEAEIMNVNSKMKLRKNSEETEEYLKYHRSNVFKGQL